MRPTSAIRDYCGREGRKKIKNGLVGRILSHHLWHVIRPFNYVLTTATAAGTGTAQDWVLTFSFGWRKDLGGPTPCGVVDGCWAREKHVFSDESLMSSLFSCAAFYP